MAVSCLKWAGYQIKHEMLQGFLAIVIMSGRSTHEGCVRCQLSYSNLTELSFAN